MLYKNKFINHTDPTYVCDETTNDVEWYVYGSASDGRVATVYPRYKIKDNDTYDDYFEDDPPSLEVAYNTEMISNTFTTNAESAGITGIETHRHLGEKSYEIKDHLGNVRATVSDIKNAEDYSDDFEDWRFLADIRSLNNYHPYGSLISAGSWSGGDYNYGYNGMLKEGIGKDIYNTHFRNLSVGDFVGWWSPDPKPNASISPYASMEQNPISKMDPLGDTTFVNRFGNATAQRHDEGELKGELVDKLVYFRDGNELEKMGEIGKEIDISRIFNFIIDKNSKESKKINIFQWAYRVMPNGKWDYKKNSNTIFGIAWNEDIKNNNGVSIDKHKHTIFNTGDYKMNSADFGNYHAGFTGSYANYGIGISKQLQWFGAGVAETLKDLYLEGNYSDAFIQTLNLSIAIPGFYIPPVGDEWDDFEWNTRGMIDADKRKKNNAIIK